MHTAAIWRNLYGYNLYNLMTKKVIMSRDVKFDKEQEWNWNSEDQPHKLIVDEEQIQKNKEEIMLAPSPST
jgi:hypothetical protein